MGGAIVFLPSRGLIFLAFTIVFYIGLVAGHVILFLFYFHVPVRVPDKVENTSWNLSNDKKAVSFRYTWNTLCTDSVVHRGRSAGQEPRARSAPCSTDSSSNCAYLAQLSSPMINPPSPPPPQIPPKTLWFCTKNNAQGCSVQLQRSPTVAWFPYLPTDVSSAFYSPGSGYSAPSFGTYYEQAINNTGGTFVSLPLQNKLRYAGDSV